MTSRSDSEFPASAAVEVRVLVFKDRLGLVRTRTELGGKVFRSSLPQKAAYDGAVVMAVGIATDAVERWEPSDEAGGDRESVREE